MKYFELRDELCGLAGGTNALYALLDLKDEELRRINPDTAKMGGDAAFYSCPLYQAIPKLKEYGYGANPWNLVGIFVDEDRAGEFETQLLNRFANFISWWDRRSRWNGDLHPGERRENLRRAIDLILKEREAQLV